MSETERRRFFSPVLLVVAVLYVLLRIIDNSASWKETSPAEPVAESPTETGENYALLLEAKDPDDERIRALWKLVYATDWELPDETGDPMPLAQEVARRAQSYYQSGNIPQAASHVQILLKWAVRLNSPGRARGGTKGLDIATLAISTAAACPGTLVYTGIQGELTSLSRAIEQASDVERIVSRYAGAPGAPVGGAKKYLANRNVLDGLLADFLSKGEVRTGSSQFFATAKCWALICPRTLTLFNQSVGELVERRDQSSKLRQQIKGLLMSRPGVS